MKELDRRDPVLSADIYKIMPEYMVKDKDDEALVSPLQDRLGKMCPLTVVFGTNEVFYAYIGRFRDYAERHGVDLDVEIGEGLCHCWIAFLGTKESDEGIKMIIDKLTKHGMELR